MTEPRVFIFEDDPNVRRFLVEAVEREGMRTCSPGSATECRQELRAERPLLVLTDLQMPEFDGVELLNLLAEERSQVPVALVSGFDSRVLGSSAKLARSLGLNVIATLTKPVGVADIQRLLLDVRETSPDSLAGDLDQAIENDEIVIHYQPRVSLQSRDRGTAIGFEALARWQHPRLGLLPPDRFIPIAEKDGRIDRLTERIIERSIKDARRWWGGGLEYKVSVNLSPQVLGNDAIPDCLDRIVREAEVDPGQVLLEVTESGAMADVVKTLEILTRFRLKGFDLAIDDFGTGYSSLVELYCMPFSELKVDKSFVMDIGTTDDAGIIIRVLVDLAHSLTMSACAEGVETEASLAALLEAGCDTAQGYLFAKPLPCEAVADWLKNWEPETWFGDDARPKMKPATEDEVQEGFCGEDVVRAMHR